MKENDIISKTKNPITISTISTDLENLGLQKADVVLVHSSLSSLGWVCGGAQAVICALQDVLGKDGTLVMPAHSGDWSDPAKWENPPVPKNWYKEIYASMPAYDKNKTPTRGIGKIPEVFRSFENTIRSSHPQVSFCANGKRSYHIIKEHSLSPQFGMKSPLGKMYKLNAKILLLGVGYESCTCFHLAETLNKKMPTTKMGTAMLINGKRKWKWFEDFDYTSDDFKYLGSDLEKSITINFGKIGNANCKLFSINQSVDFASKWILRHRFSHL